MGNRWHDGYSSHVDLYLNLDGRAIGVAWGGPDSLELDVAENLPECCAELVVRVDEGIERRPIVLFEGASCNDPHVKFFEVAAGANKTAPLA